MATPLSTKDLRKILDELYELDGSLRGHEEELAKIIRELAGARPASTIDKRFVKQLKHTLTHRINELSMSKKQEDERNVANRFSFKPFAFATGGLVIGLLAAFMVFKWPGVFTSSVIPSFDESESWSHSAGIQIARLGGEAFGSISIQNKDTGEIAPQGFGAGGGGGYALDARAATEEGPGALSSGTAIRAPSSILLPEYMKTYEYVYTGDDIVIDSAQMDVYKQMIGSQASGNLNTLVSRMDLGLIDLGSFSGMSVQSISLKQDTEFGYMVFANPSTGDVSISQNWEQWRSIEPACLDDEKCWEAYWLKAEDVPSDDEIIAVADDFIRRYNIDHASYGAPEVVRNWEVSVVKERANTIPDTIQVVYPLMIEGKPVYDASGNKTGLFVQVNLRVMKVAYINNIRALAYQASAYDVITDVQEILDQAKYGGMYGYAYEGAEVVRVEIGTPELSLVQISNYTNGEYAELIVPALIFPVTGTVDDPNFWRKNIIVPIVQGVMEQVRPPVARPLPEPVPMPLIESESAESVDGEMR